MAANLNMDELRARAVRAGLPLSDDDLQKLLPGVNRTQEQVAELRAYFPDDAEPAAVFNAAKIGTG